MDEIVYSALMKYFNALEKLGYYKYDDVYSLLVLCFYSDLLYHNYRGKVSKEDYLLIEKALNCLYGTNCLMPYPNYMKLGDLHLGDMTELAQRVKNLENSSVVKVIHDLTSVDNYDTASDIIIKAEE